MTKATVISKDTMTIEEACIALEYTPNADSWDKKDDKAKWQEITKKKNERQVKAAKTIVNTFASSDDAKALPPEVVEAMLRLAPTKSTRTGGGGTKNPFMDNMRALFPKKGTTVSEIDVFVATKMGRGEMRAKVRTNLKSAEPASRMWIEFLPELEEWTLLAVGAKQPKGWKGQAIEDKA